MSNRKRNKFSSGSYCNASQWFPLSQCRRSSRYERRIANFEMQTVSALQYVMKYTKPIDSFTHPLQTEL